MGLTNAEKQARWRARQKERLDALLRAAGPAAGDEVERLRAENARLRAELRSAASQQPSASDAELRNVIKRVRKENGLLKAQLRGQHATKTIVDVKLQVKAIVDKRLPLGDVHGKALEINISDAITLFLENQRKFHVRILRMLAKLEAHAPSKAAILRAKLEAMIADRGASEGEKAAARAALERRR